MPKNQIKNEVWDNTGQSRPIQRQTEDDGGAGREGDSRGECKSTNGRTDTRGHIYCDGGFRVGYSAGFAAACAAIKQTIPLNARFAALLNNIEATGSRPAL
jgi:hypothetical protein